MRRILTGAPYGCLPPHFRQVQQARERAELAAIARGFRNPELAGEHAARVASKQSGGAL